MFFITCLTIFKKCPSRFLVKFYTFQRVNILNSDHRKPLHCQILKTSISCQIMLLETWDRAQSIRNLMQYPKMWLFCRISQVNVEKSEFEKNFFLIFSKNRKNIFFITCLTIFKKCPIRFLVKFYTFQRVNILKSDHRKPLYCSFL